MNPVLSSQLRREIMNVSKKSLVARISVAKVLLQAASLLVSMALSFPSATDAADTGNTGRKFASPEEAVASLRLATTKADSSALRDIFGPSVEDLQNPDGVQARNELMTF